MQKIGTIMVLILLTGSILIIFKNDLDLVHGNGPPTRGGIDFEMDMDILNVSEASFYTEHGNDLANMATGVGDVNGDGYDDVMIGAPFNDEGAADSGQAYLIFGNASGMRIDTSLSDVDASFIGEESRSYLGESVSGAGDVNGDGYDDILIGAHGAGNSQGKSYIIFGKESGWKMDSNLSDADTSFIGENNRDNAGRSVSGVGDVNGDGYDDFIIGAHENDEGGFNSGQVYLILGKESGWSNNTDLSNADASFIGEGQAHYAGMSVSGAGDVNGDGYDDFLINAMGSPSRREKTYLIFGKEAGWSTDVKLSDVNASIVGDYYGAGVAMASSGAGDFNGDGYDDVLIGIPNNDSGGGDAGQTYLIFGKSSGWSVNISMNDSGASFIGEEAGDYSGTQVSRAGDVNKDGYDDILISSTGEIYLIYGRSSGLFMGRSLSLSDASFINGSANYLTVSGAGDVNGDGFDDIISGSRYRAYLIMGTLLNSQPQNVHSVETFSDPSYSNEVSTAFQTSKLYIEIRGQDSNSSQVDWTILDIFFPTSTVQPLFVRVFETGINTGIYRGCFFVPANLEILDEIKIVSRQDSSEFDRVFVDSPFRPTSIDSVKVYLSDNYEKEIDKIQINETVHIELIGQDANPLTQDFAFINITTDKTISLPVVILIRETDLDTGIYRGEFVVPNSTAKIENITFGSAKDPTKYALVMICTFVEIGPIEPVKIALEDEEYHVQYSNLGFADTSTWTYQLDIDWLTFDVDALILSGTPDNEDVGTIPVSFNLSDDIGHFDVQEFILTVKNVAPTIITEPVIEVKEGDQYQCDFDSTDDGQGIIRWSMIGVNSWMTIDETTGWLTGTPTNEEVGVHNISVMVNDGNGGVNSSTFQLTVIDLNVKPTILTTDITTGIEGERYYREYEAHDPDNTIDFIWELITDANFLTLDSETGVLEGTPGPFDVGEWNLNVTVKDQGGLMDSHIFILTIVDVDSIPSWLTVPDDIEIYHGEYYTFTVNATDPDHMSSITFSIESKPESDITINPETGLIDWRTSIHWFEKEPYNLKVTVRVSDGQNFNLHMFTITVLPTVPPTSEITGPIGGERTSSSATKLEWRGTDPEDEPITYEIYLHQTEAFVIGFREEALYVSDYPGENITLRTLDPGNTYYWTVRPYDGCSYGTCSSDVQSFRVNFKPTFRNIEDHEVPAGTNFKFKISCTDQDPEDLSNLRFSLVDAPEGMTISEENGMIKWTPKDDQVMLHLVTVGISDGIETNTATFKVEVIEGESSTSSLLIIILIAVLVVIIAAIGILLFIKQKKKINEEALKQGEEERAVLEKEREDEYASYEELYGVPAPAEEEEEELTTQELRDRIHEQIEKLENMEM